MPKVAQLKPFLGLYNQESGEFIHCGSMEMLEKEIVDVINEQGCTESDLEIWVRQDEAVINCSVSVTMKG